MQRTQTASLDSCKCPCICLFDCCFIQKFHFTSPMAKLTRDPEKSLSIIVLHLVTLLRAFVFSGSRHFIPCWPAFSWWVWKTKGNRNTYINFYCNYINFYSFLEFIYLVSSPLCCHIFLFLGIHQHHQANTMTTASKVNWHSFHCVLLLLHFIHPQKWIE